MKNLNRFISNFFERSHNKYIMTSDKIINKVASPNEPKYKYTLGIIHCPETNQILLLNREKAPWMGRWNGVGGKLSPQEDPLACIIRETEEETGLYLPQYKHRGVLKWFLDGIDYNGTYLFTATISKTDLENYKTPVVFCHEGILDWKKLDWVLHKDNTGVVDNLKIVLKTLFNSNEFDLYITKYIDLKLFLCNYYPDGRLDDKINNSICHEY